MVARTQKKEETMKLINVFRPGGGLDEAVRFIVVLVASSLYLAFAFYYFIEYRFLLAYLTVASHN